MIFVGVDIGTTRTKALLLDTKTGERRVVARETPLVPSPAGDLRDADAVLATVVDAIGEAVTGLTSGERASVAGIGVTSLSEEVVLLDAGGAPVGLMPTWYNNVAASAADEGADPSFSWAKLRWAHDVLASGSSPLFPGVCVDRVSTITTLNGYVADRVLRRPRRRLATGDVRSHRVARDGAARPGPDRDLRRVRLCAPSGALGSGRARARHPRWARPLLRRLRHRRAWRR